jgi:hypothetical protein
MTITIPLLEIAIPDVHVEFDVVAGTPATRYYPGEPEEITIKAVVATIDGQPMDILPMLDEGNLEEIESHCYDSL